MSVFEWVFKITNVGVHSNTKCIDIKIRVFRLLKWGYSNGK
jgi:hypothetical protein